MGLSRNVSEIDGDIRRKSQIFSTPVVFCAHAEGVAYWNWVSAKLGQKTRMMALAGPQRSSTSSAIWIECMNVSDRRTDRRTDRQTDTGPQQRPRLRRASCGKKTTKLAKETLGMSRLALRTICKELLVTFLIWSIVTKPYFSFDL